ncbi:MAG: hypothetical protein HYX85_02640 [Chloroflexi bacterium]|nr:hypothetical protein [Chloroflexota bacterium]
MNAARWFGVIVVAAVIGLLGGLVGVKLDSILETDKGTEGVEKEEGSILEAYRVGIVFLEGSTAFPDAHGIATFETKQKNGVVIESIFKLQLEDADTLAKTTLNVSIDGVNIGVLKIDGKGNGTMTVKKKANELFPAVHDGSLLEVKTADSTLVASGSFN